MAALLDIYNLALGHLAMNKVNSTTGVDPSTVACNNNYVTCRDDVFSESRWPFATARAALTLSAVTVLGWTYVYVYPTTAARVWFVFDEATVDTKHEQEFEVIYDVATGARVICSELSTAYAEYTYKVTDTTIYNPKFVMALSYRLAAAMAHTLTGDPAKGEALMGIYNAMISEAKRLSFAERIKKPTQTSGYVNSRG